MTPVISTREIAVAHTPVHALGAMGAATNYPKGTEPSADDPPVIARIKERMRAGNVSQAELARRIESTPVTVWKYLTGVTGVEKALVRIARALDADVEYLAHGGEEAVDPHSREIETFISEIGPKLSPPLSKDEVKFVRHWPYHRVTRGKLLDAIIRLREGGLTEEEAAASTVATDAARAKGAALNVPARRKSR